MQNCFLLFTEKVIMSGQLFIVRGIQGSGKSEFAQQWVRENPTQRVRVNMDALRAMLYGKGKLTPEEEKVVRAVEANVIRAALAQNKHVIVDNVNLSNKYTTEYQRIALEMGAVVLHKDINVELDEALKRVKARVEQPVPEDIIVRTHKRYVKNGKLLPFQHYMVEDSYIPDTTLPKAFILDVDGTAMLLGDRDPYDYERVCDDEPYEAVINVVKALQEDGYSVVTVSGRDDSCLDDTLVSLQVAGVNPAVLHMRETGDGRPDYVVKREIFNNLIRDKYNVQFCLDDRDTVVRMWRELGIPTFQVAPGAF